MTATIHSKSMMVVIEIGEAIVVVVVVVMCIYLISNNWWKFFAYFQPITWHCPRMWRFCIIHEPFIFVDNTHLRWLLFFVGCFVRTFWRTILSGEMAPSGPSQTIWCWWYYRCGCCSWTWYFWMYWSISCNNKNK